MSTTSKGQADEQAITTMLRGLGWNVEIARVSKGHFDRIAWVENYGEGKIWWNADWGNPSPTTKRLLLQLKRNGRPEKGFFTNDDPIYKSLPSERLWVCHWTKGKKNRRTKGSGVTRAVGSTKGKWTVWWYEFQGIKSEDFTL